MAVDMFLKLDGIDGDSTSKGHEKQIEILSYSWGLSNFGGGGVQAQDFSFVKEPDIATGELLEAACSGKHISTGVLTLLKPSSSTGAMTEYLKITLTDSLVSSYQTGGSNTGVPAEQITFTFQKVEIAVRASNGTWGAGTSCHLGAK